MVLLCLHSLKTTGGLQKLQLDTLNGILATKRGGVLQNPLKKISVIKIELNFRRHRILTFMLGNRTGMRRTTDCTKKRITTMDGHDILRIFDVLPNFPFTASEAKPDY